MNRREWLRNASIIVAGAVAADQIEIIDRLSWRRRFFGSADVRGRAAVLVNGEWRVLESHRTADGHRAWYEPEHLSTMRGFPEIVTAVRRGGVVDPIQTLHLLSSDTLTITWNV